MKQKNQYSTFPFSNELFGENEVTNISEKVEKNIAVLLSENDYLKLDKELEDLNLKLNTLLNSPELELFQEFIRVNSDIISYQHCLAYYLGFQSGIKVNDFEQLINK